MRHPRASSEADADAPGTAASSAQALAALDQSGLGLAPQRLTRRRHRFIALDQAAMSLFVYLVTLLTVAAIAASRAVAPAAAMLRARAERRRFSEPAPAELHPGRVELAGMVEVDPPDAPAVAVRIRQQAFDGGTSKNRLFDWKEQDRAVDARPFTLVLHGTGARVDVQPAGRPILLAQGVIDPMGSGSACSMTRFSRASSAGIGTGLRPSRPRASSET